MTIRSEKTAAVLMALKKFPETPSLTLARYIVKKHPNLFKDIEAARTSIRYYSGKRGAGLKKCLVNKTYLDRKTVNPYRLPKSRAVPVQPFELPIKVGKGLIMNDIHIPLHDVTALSAALEYGKKIGVNFILLNGDIVDCHDLSRFLKRPDQPTFEEELAAFVEFLDVLSNEFPEAKIFYKLGNHEKRFEANLIANSPALFGIPGIDWKSFVKLSDFNSFGTDDDGDIVPKWQDRGIKVIAENRKIQYGSLTILHGHEMRFSSPVSPARGLYNKAKVNCLVGHFHQITEYSEHTLNKELITTWSVGCLCDLSPEYDRNNTKWQHGFGVLHCDNKNWRFENKKIINGKVV